jgi:hypothetical protein
VLAFGGWMEKTVGMRGSPDPQLSMLTSLSAEDLIAADHPIRRACAAISASAATATPVAIAPHTNLGIPPSTTPPLGTRLA